MVIYLAMNVDLIKKKKKGGTVVEVACLIEIKALCGASNITEAHPEVK